MRRSTVLSLPPQLVFPAMAYGGSTVVEPSTHKPKTKGLSPVCGSMRENMAKKKKSFVYDKNSIFETFL